ncbi:unnamed protein product [Lymnaea stagnalis]|uniref:BRISC and BRCA1-A complex member 2 n=1 Tax=Lymnaea stagnalis TaxID=6523 RepID=A0AAV2I316_LYMST
MRWITQTLKKREIYKLYTITISGVVILNRPKIINFLSSVEGFSRLYHLINMDTELSRSIQSLDPHFQPFVHYLLEQSCEITLTNESLQISEPCSGCYPKVTMEGIRYDRFKLNIPYAQQQLTWEIIFDSANWKEPPDFIFDAEDDDFFPPMEQINSLICWDWKNKESLAAAVTELLELYKDYQLERASTNSTLQRHLRSLLAENPKELQIVINRTEHNFGTVNVLMKLEVNFSNLPPYLQEGNPGKGTAVLYVWFPNPESSSVKSQLYLSPTVESAFGGSSKLHIPVFQQGILLGEYFALINQLLAKQVSLISDCFQKKQKFTSGLLAYFVKSVIEYDVNKIVLLLEWNDFFFTFTVELPQYFPTEPPVYIFKSVYHNQNKKPYTERHTEFPYSPRWSGVEMAKRTSAFIWENIKNFQTASVNNSDR